MIRAFLITLIFFTILSFCAPLAQAQDQASTTTEQSQDKPAETPEENKTEDGGSNPESIDRSKIPIPLPIDKSKQQDQDLKHYLTQAELQPMLAGTEEFITLEQRSRTANSKGVVIFIPDWLQTPTNPKAINFLRNQLPDLGWVTIALQPADMPENFPSHALESTEQLEQNQKALEQYQEKLMAKLTVLMEKTQNYPGLLFVVTAGNHAGILLDLYQQEKIEKPSAMLLLSSYSVIETEAIKLAQNVSESAFPVLDLYLSRDNKLAQSSAQQRKVAADKTMKVFYRQKQLTSFKSGYYPQRTLLKEINGWFKSIGW